MDVIRDDVLIITLNVVSNYVIVKIQCYACIYIKKFWSYTATFPGSADILLYGVELMFLRPLQACEPFKRKTLFWKCSIAQENANNNDNNKISSELWFKAMMDLGRAMCYSDRTQYAVHSAAEHTLISPAGRVGRNRKGGKSDKGSEPERSRQGWGGERHAALGRSEARCRRGP